MRRAHAPHLALLVLIALSSFACGRGGGSDKTVPPPNATAGSEAVLWLSYGDGVARAAAEGKPMILDFWTDWCHWCKVMDKDTYGNAEVRRQIAQHFIAVKVDAESEKPQGGAGSPTGVELARNFGVASYPTTWFVDSQGEKIAPLPGFVPPEEFGVVLDYIASGSYKTQTFQAYQTTRGGASS